VRRKKIFSLKMLLYCSFEDGCLCYRFEKIQIDSEKPRIGVFIDSQAPLRWPNKYWEGVGKRTHLPFNQFKFYPISVIPNSSYILFFFIYSYVHTMFGPFLPPSPCPLPLPLYLLTSRQKLFWP
jgi:hypothetical protein